MIRRCILMAVILASSGSVMAQCFQIGSGLGLPELGQTSLPSTSNFTYGCERVQSVNEYAATVRHNSVSLAERLAVINFENGIALYSRSFENRLQLAGGLTSHIQGQFLVDDDTDFRLAAGGGTYTKIRINSPWPFGVEATHRLIPFTTGGDIVHQVNANAIYDFGQSSAVTLGTTVQSGDVSGITYQIGIRL